MQHVKKRPRFGMPAACELRGTSDECKVAFMEQRNPAGQFHRFPHIVGHEDGGLAEIGAQPQEFTLQIETRYRIECAERLVKQQNFRIGRQRAGHTHPLTLSSRELAWKPVGEAIGRKVDSRQQVSNSRGDFRFGPAFEPWHKADVASHREVREKAAFLNHVADAAAEPNEIPIRGCFCPPRELPPKTA